MKKLFFSAIICAVMFTAISLNVFAKDFIEDADDGTYTVEISGRTPGKDYTLIVVAGDYTDKDMPEISEDNIIYINQVTADENGVVSFTAFIPMTGSVGTVYIGGDEEPSEEGVLMTESGFGYIAGRLISYSGYEPTVTVPENFTSIDTGAFEEENSTERVIIRYGSVSIDVDAFAEGTKLFLSPLADSAKQFAIDNGYAYSVIGDYNGDNIVNIDDYKAVIYAYAKDGKISGENLDIILDLDLDGTITLNDASVLLRFLGNKIADFYMAYTESDSVISPQ